MLTHLIAVLSLTLTVQDESPAPANAETPPVLQLELPENSGVVETSAREYAAYHRVVADLRDAPIGSGEDLDRAMDRLTSFYGEDQLVRAWIAYAAIIASRHPEYLDEVRELADYYGPQSAISGLIYDPTYATSFATSDVAEAHVVDVLEQDSAQLREVSERYRLAAYDLQSEQWANRRASDRRQRLAMLESIGQRPIALTDEFNFSFDERFEAGLPASALFERMDIPAARVNAAPSPHLTLNVGEAAPDPDRTRVGRILSVAALQSISDDPSEVEQAIQSLLSDPIVERCLAWVRLDLQQCVAAGHFKYEDSFCISEHALLDVSRCLGAASSE
ncbi:hypothetical protein [Maricaulis sp. CAU 1757]